MKTLVKNGTVVTSTNEFVADILIENEKIAMIGQNLEDPEATVIDATGKYVLPGGVDNHSHFEAINTDGVTTNAGYDTTWVALKGGTTTIVDFCTNEPGMNLMESLDYRLNVRAKGKLAPDMALHGCCTDFTEETLDEIPKMIEFGVPSMKLFLAYKPTALYMDDFKLLSCLKKAAEHGMTMMVHAENPDVLDFERNSMAEKGCLEPKYHYMTRPPYGEAEAVSRAIRFADAAGCPLCVVHVSCVEAAKVIQDARANGSLVIGETCPHYLVLDKHKMDDPDFDQACRWVCSPPLRDEEDREYLWKCLNHDWLSIVGSDNASIPLYQKHWGEGDFRAIPNGCPGAGDRLNALWTYGVAKGKMTKQKLVDVYATQPAKLNGIFPQKGTIDIGSDGDLVIFDPEYKGTITLESNPTGVDYNIFEGMEQIGRADTVILRGEVVVEGGEYLDKPVMGKFIPGKPYGLAYDLLK